MTRYIISILLFTCFQFNIYCQVISGIVLDKNTGKAIENAVVYFNGTFLGTYSDQKGYFELDIKQNISSPLTVSSLGYYSETLYEYQVDEPITVYLKIKTIDLNEVTISAKRNLRSRNRNFKIFRDIFLGTTENARMCVIMNENDILLFKTNDTLHAYSKKPIEIFNEALGYKITYYLDKFEFVESSGEYSYSGNIIFKEDLLFNGNKDQLLERRREAYLGSKLHFFRALWVNNLDIEGFVVEGNSNAAKELQYDDFVKYSGSFRDENSPKFLKYNGVLNVSYTPNHSTCRVNFMKDSTFFYKNGHFDGASINWAGGMETNRIADLLPLNYFYKNNPSTISSNQISEKVYLHIDKDIYNPGEDIWFKAYVVDFLTNKLSPNTNNLHVDLISPESEIIQHRIIRISKGLGNGDFRLSDSLPAGKYAIRAYSNLMRNFGDEFFFNKEIYVVNSNVNSIIRDSIRYLQDRLYLDFFPEGGSLIDNVTSIVAFKATDALGKGINVKGQIFSNAGEYINNFESTNLGMGVFMLKPGEGKSYHVMVNGPDGKPYKAGLPGSFPIGVVLHGFITLENKLLLKVLTNDNTLPSYYNKELKLTISIRDLFSTTLNLRISSTINNFLIPLNDFPQGILRLTLSDPTGKSLAERLIFNNKNHAVRINIASDRQLYKLRDPVSTTISLTGDTGTRAYLSLSVFDYRMSSDTLDYSTNIASWFLLESEVRGHVENPSSYFDVANDNRFDQLDLLLLTQGWRDFAWKYDTLKSYENENGFSLKGKVMKTPQGKPFSLAKINFAIFDEKKAIFLTKEADTSGFFHADNLDITGRARILVSCADQKNKLTGYVFVDSIFYEPPGAFYSQYQTYKLQPSRFVRMAEDFRDFNLFKKKFRLSDTLNIGEVFVTSQRIDNPIEMGLKSSRAIYGKPDNEFILSSRHRNYPHMSQVMAGNIPGVEIFTKLGEPRVTIRGETPLILIDGIPTGNELSPGGAKLREDLSPSEVERIDVLYWSSPFGSKGANGIINFITKRGDYNYEALNTSHSRYIYCNGYDQPKIFYSPKRETKYFEGQTPDFRRTLLWEPNLDLDSKNKSEFKFYNSDIATTVLIKVEGITEDGIPVVGTYKYEVE